MRREMYSICGGRKMSYIAEMAVNTYNHSILKAEAGGSSAQGQSEFQSKSLPQKTKKGNGEMIQWWLPLVPALGS